MSLTTFSIKVVKSSFDSMFLVLSLLPPSQVIAFYIERHPYAWTESVEKEICRKVLTLVQE